MLAAELNPPSSQVVVSTIPMAAVACAPRCPTIAASMKNITVADICAKMLGILKLTMSLSFSACVIVRPSRIYDNSSSLLLGMDVVLITAAKLLKKWRRAKAVRQKENLMQHYNNRYIQIRKVNAHVFLYFKKNCRTFASENLTTKNQSKFKHKINKRYENRKTA
jgi:hypothetical protein